MGINLIPSLKERIDLDELKDVEAPTPSDGDSVVYDEASELWLPQAIAAAWAEITGKPDSPSLEEMAEEHGADGKHGVITPESCSIRYTHPTTGTCPQDPKAHDLAGAAHDADTLANLNTKVSDATLDDSSASRTPTAHKDSHVNSDSIRDATASLKGLATAAQITKLDGIATAATKYPDTGEQAFLDVDYTKLDGIEAEATKYPDTGEQAFLDADHTKLDGIAAGAIANLIEDTTPQLGGDLDAQSKRISALKSIGLDTFSELTISAGVITLTQTCHTVDTEGDAASDDLDTITVPAGITFFVLRAENDARTVVLKHNTDNIWLQGKADISLDDVGDGILMFYDGTRCFDIAAGGAGGATTYLGLTDTPSSYTGKAGQVPKVNAGEDVLEFVQRGWEIVDDHLFTVAATSYTISGLDGDNDVAYKALIFLAGDHADSIATIFLRPNNDAGTNYPSQVLRAYAGTEGGNDGTVVAGPRSGWTGMVVGAAAPSCIGWSFTFLHAKAGELRPYYSCQYYLAGGAVNQRNFQLIAGSWTNTADNMTSLVFVVDRAGGFGINSKIILLRRART